MSRINDALKRAKRAQRDSPASAPELALRPVEPGQPVQSRAGLWVGLSLAVLAGTFGVTAMLQLHKQPSISGAVAPVVPAPQTPPSSATDSAPESPAGQQLQHITPTVPSASPVPAAVMPQEPNQPPIADVHQPAPAETPRVSSPASQAARAIQTPTPANPNPAPVATQAAPQQVPLRLQAIMFHPTRPSAMIGGKTLFIGDHLGEMRLVAIGRESATLVSVGRTNILTLAQ